MTKQEQILNDSRYTPIHEHGFVGLIDTMGDDQAICQAARVSYGSGTKSVSDDRNLIRYLIRHRHSSPIEMAELKFHLKLPIFVMRQLVRHRTANLNEYSGRYSVLSDEFYIPADDYVAPQSSQNKQGRAGEMQPKHVSTVRAALSAATGWTYTVYQSLLGEEKNKQQTTEYSALHDDEYPGLSRELARTVMPVANYTEAYWKIDLRNFFHFTGLRMDAHAQREIVDFATAMYDLAKPHFPLACQAFEDYMLNSVTLSAMDVIALNDILQGTFVSDAAHYGMSKREFAEFEERWRISDRRFCQCSAK